MMKRIALAATLDHLSLGLTAMPVVLVEWAISMMLLGIGAFRIGWLGEPGLALPQYRLSFRSDQALVAGAFVVLLVAAGGWSASSIAQAAHDQPKPFTRLSLDNHASDVEPPRLVVQNEEGQPMTYDVAVDMDGQRTVWVPGVALNPGDQYSAALPDNPDQQTIDVLLFRAGDADVYRRLSIPAPEASSQ